eukprot:GHVS01059673.1.p2 GENE.GHVS01059673.1~~GHVS01059673.1.p2  ORF type:complete len:142 (-),score=8.27 GHVS01059673.1:292-717(-)
MVTFRHLTEVPDVQKEEFSKVLATHFADVIAGALSSLSRAIQAELRVPVEQINEMAENESFCVGRPLVHRVDGELTVNTMLTNVKRMDDNTLGISCVSTFSVVPCDGEVKVRHEHSMYLPKWVDGTAAVAISNYIRQHKRP